jgi:hypothetical protein
MFDAVATLAFNSKSEGFLYSSLLLIAMYEF